MSHTIRVVRMLAAAAASACALLLVPAAASATPVIVNVIAGGNASAVASSVGVTPEVVFGSSGPGFAADLTADQVTQLRRNRFVESIVADRIVGYLAAAKPGGSTTPPAQPAQEIRSAQRRVGLLRSVTADVDGIDDARVDVDIAIFDGGVDATHPDLSVVGGLDCASGQGWYDRDGHGTMVAGFAAAIDNGIGIAGTAPGARIWAIRVADPKGLIHDSGMRCGLEWLNRNAGTIEVANMSYSGGDPLVGPCGVVSGRVKDRLHAGVCSAVAAGVTVVVAAGNDAIDAGTVSPSAWPETIAVSATAETDGLPGGFGPAPCLAGELDDHLATFSNFGSAVDIAAPGVCLTSTYLGGMYAFNSGTSFSSPLVAGAAGLVAATHPGASPGSIRATLLAAAEPGPIPGDVDGFAEGLLDISTL